MFGFHPWITVTFRLWFYVIQLYKSKFSTLWLEAMRDIKVDTISCPVYVFQ